MPVDSPLAGRTALVTGGAKRLGRAVCLALGERGAHVAVHYNSSASEAEDVVGELSGHGLKAWAVQADLGVEEEVRELFAAVVELTGPVDILINNASIFPEGRLADVTAETVGENVQVNALAPLALSRALAAQGRTGAIVNFLDTRIHDYDREHVAYHLSKRMLYTLTRISALEFAPKVRVNGVAPGVVLPPVGKDESYLERLAETNPLKAHGSEADVARAVMFLLESPFVTGQVIHVDGGRHMLSGVYG